MQFDLPRPDGRRSATRGHIGSLDPDTQEWHFRGKSFKLLRMVWGAYRVVLKVRRGDGSKGSLVPAESRVVG